MVYLIKLCMKKIVRSNLVNLQKGEEMAPLIKRFAESMNSYVKQSSPVENKKSVNTTAGIEYYGSMNNDENIKQPNDEGTKQSIKTPSDVLKHCQKFSNPAMGALHYIKNMVLLPVLGVFRLFASVRSNHYGGSSSSFFRNANIKRNIDLVTAYLVNSKNHDNFNYDNVITNGKERKERNLMVNGQPYLGKTVFETTEIAIYRTCDGDLIGVERGALFNHLKDGVMLYDHRKDNLDEFIRACKDYRAEVTNSDISRQDLNLPADTYIPEMSLQEKKLAKQLIKAYAKIPKNENESPGEYRKRVVEGFKKEIYKCYRPEEGVGHKYEVLTDEIVGVLDNETMNKLKCLNMNSVDYYTQFHSIGYSKEADTGKIQFNMMHPLIVYLFGIYTSNVGIEEDMIDIKTENKEYFKIKVGSYDEYHAKKKEIDDILSIVYNKFGTLCLAKQDDGACRNFLV